MSAKQKAGIACAAVMLLAAVAWLAGRPRDFAAMLPYSQFLDQVRAGNVASVVIFGGQTGSTPVTCRLKDGRVARTVLPSDYRDALAVLQENRAGIEIRDFSSAPLRLLLNATPFLVLLAVWIFFFLRRFPHGRWPTPP